MTQFTEDQIWVVTEMAKSVSASMAGVSCQLERIAALMKESTLESEKAAKYDALHTPQVEEFTTAVQNEALYQREHWGVKQDGGKTDADWFWLVGYLAGKALHDVKGKRLHHLITAAAALLNWHAYATGAHTAMRPGIEAPPS